MSSFSGRFWHFAIVVLLGIIAVATAMGALHRHLAIENYKEILAEQNAELAVALSTSLASEVRKLHDFAATQSWAELQESPAIDRFGTLVGNELDLLPVYAVNVFTPDGLILYSAVRQRIGALMPMNEGIEMATAGEPVTAIVRRNSFNRYDHVIEDRDMVETFLPLRDESGDVIGVFEIHAEISDFLARIDRMQRTVVIGVSAALMSLYLLVMASFWRSDRRLLAGLSLPGRRRGENDAENVRRAKSEFVAAISHDVRTPLNAVLGMTDLLNLTNLTRKQREYIHTIQSSGDMLISLVDNLLDYSHLESGDLELQVREFDVVDLLERVLKIMGHSAYSKKLELILDLRHDLDLRIIADRRRLQQILVNVINNAIKFTETGEVVLRADTAESPDGRFIVRFEVADTGPGIDGDERARLLVAFASGARPTADQLHGTRLGLTISKQLLDTMGGKIDVASRSTGGMVVTIELPVERASPAGAEEPEGLQQGLQGRVLSLQANRSMAGSIYRLLTAWGLHCEELFETKEGMHRLRVAASGGQPFDCVIVDSALTPADPLLTVRRIRKSRESSDVPVVLLTSISEPLAVGEVSALGNVRCINKPVLPLELRYTLLRLLADEYESMQQAPRTIETAEGASDLRVLIAEDNPVSRGVLQSMLRAEGFDADAVEDGPAVLEALEAHHYDLLLLDCQMPGMDGDVVTRSIRGAPERYSGNPIIVAVTADATENHRTQCLAAGMDDFMPKPVRLESLRHGLRRWIAVLAERSPGKAQNYRADLRQSIAKRTGRDDDSFLSDYIGLFLDDTESRIAAMAQAVSTGDTEILRRECHALKGSCLELGADRMARFCEELSVAARKDNPDEVGIVLGRMDSEFARLRPVYQSAQVSSTRPK
jgi:signal transduction histidine kinase/DNA-binding response OmpR family regulator